MKGEGDMSKGEITELSLRLIADLLIRGCQEDRDFISKINNQLNAQGYQFAAYQRGIQGTYINVEPVPTISPL